MRPVDYGCNSPRNVQDCTSVKCERWSGIEKRLTSKASYKSGPFPPPALAGLTSVGSEEAPNEELASVRRTNRTYSFPVSGFHERAFAICSEGMSETRLTSLNSVRNRLVGYSFHAALRHRLVRCDHSRRIIQPSS